MHTLLSVHAGTGVLTDWIWGRIPLATFWPCPDQLVQFIAFLRLKLNFLWANTWLPVIWKD